MPSEYHKKRKYRKREARKRNLEFSLTAQDLRQLLKGDRCFYCRVRDFDPTVDRIHSEAGYHRDNVVTACEPCNKRKGSKPVEEVLVRTGGQVTLT